MRLFLAVDIPDQIREAIRAFQQDLANVCEYRVAWVQPALFHVTLLFLGNVSEEAMQACYNDLQAHVGTWAPLQFSTRGLVAFPSWSQPRVVGVELHDVGDRARVLREQLMALFKNHAVVVQGASWRPHVTLGRIKNHGPKDRMLLRSPESLLWSVSRITLMESNLSHAGPTYTTRATFSLLSDV